MMRNRIAIVLLVPVLISMASAAYAIVTYPISKLSIITAQGRVDFSVEVATTPPQLEHGLMFRTFLARDHGMLFNVGLPRHVDMWMKNTLIPLDMIFIGGHGVITQIVRNTIPQSEQIISSDRNDVRAVLELSGGAADYYHVSVGDRVDYDLFK